MAGEEITQLLANQPIKLTPETDFFNTIPKAETILSFIESFSESLKENKLLALYGGWGSGKTSLIKYLQEKLDGPNFSTIYFETWKYEKDDNLALSLVDVIIDKVDKRHKQVIQNFKNISFSLMKNFAKSISFQIPGINIDANTLLSGLENDITAQNDSMSFHQKMKTFETSYKEIEKKLLKDDKEHIIVFIDDLDRCEPENILNLLTALKHFFSNGKRTIFFCGIDKKAVTEAVKHKYKDVVKSEEYLEKIFDINFNMPNILDIRKLLEYYFSDRSINIGLVQMYLNEIGFKTPRHLKKVFNKFLILKFVQQKGIDFDELIPNLEKGNSLNVILVIHFIILYEFHRDIYYDLKDAESRIQNLSYNYYQYLENAGEKVTFEASYKRFRKRYGNTNIHFGLFLSEERSDRLNFLHLLLPSPNKIFDPSISSDDTESFLEYISNFTTDNNIQLNLARFLLKNQKNLTTQNKDYAFNRLFAMIEKHM